MAKKKRVAIMGKGPGRGLTPRNKSYKVWGINNAWVGQYVSMIWDMHDMDWTAEDCRNHYSHLVDYYTPEEVEEKIKSRLLCFEASKAHAIKHNIPIMSVKTYEGVPGFEYPLERIINKFDCDLFTSATPYAIAYAIYKKYTHIDLFGVNCMHGDEWEKQRDAVVGWLMLAKGKGIKVTVSGQKFRPLRAWDGRLYGYGIPQEPKGMQVMEKLIHLEHDEEDTYKVWREI